MWKCLCSLIQPILFLFTPIPPFLLSSLSAGDETYHDIFRDFSQMASNNPEKLKRRSADIKTP